MLCCACLTVSLTKLTWAWAAPTLLAVQPESLGGSTPGTPECTQRQIVWEQSPCTLKFCSTRACTLLILWQYFQISWCHSGWLWSCSRWTTFALFVGSSQVSLAKADHLLAHAWSHCSRSAGQVPLYLKGMQHAAAGQGLLKTPASWQLSIQSAHGLLHICWCSGTAMSSLATAPYPELGLVGSCQTVQASRSALVAVQ